MSSPQDPEECPRYLQHPVVQETGQVSVHDSARVLRFCMLLASNQAVDFLSSLKLRTTFLRIFESLLSSQQSRNPGSLAGTGRRLPVRGPGLPAVGWRGGRLDILTWGGTLGRRVGAALPPSSQYPAPEPYTLSYSAQHSRRSGKS